ncbi:hypothetical protein CRYUN_Cryun27aG0089800 [Craigia yunnanensis]
MTLYEQSIYGNLLVIVWLMHCQELLKALIGFIDVTGIYFALTQLTQRNISQNHKFKAVGLGWAFADFVLHRLAPLWVGARGLEFTWDYILQGLVANANLVCSFFFFWYASLVCSFLFQLLFPVLILYQ